MFDGKAPLHFWVYLLFISTLIANFLSKFLVGLSSSRTISSPSHKVRWLFSFAFAVTVPFVVRQDGFPRVSVIYEPWHVLDDRLWMSKVRFSLKVLNEIITERWAETVRVLLVWIRRKTVTVMESFLMKINGCFVSHIWAVFRVALSLLFCGQYCVIFLWGSYFPKFLPKLIGKYFI